MEVRNRNRGSMKRYWINRESDMILKPDLGFVKEGVKGLKKTGICYAYNKKQAEEIQKLYKQKYNQETICKTSDWYYIIKVCN